MTKAADRRRQVFGAIFFVFIVLLACLWLCGCSSSPDDSSSEADTRVAATVEGESITEQEVSDYIASYRSGMGYAEDSAWAQYLYDNGETAEDVRHTTIVQLASDIVIQKEGDRLGLTVSDGEIDAKVQEFRESLMAEDDDTWNSTLEQYDTTEEDLRERYRKEILKDKVFEKDVARTEPTDQDIKSYIEENLAGTTTKRFEVFYNPDYTRMQSFLDEIQEAKSKKAGLAAARKASISVAEMSKAKDNEKVVYEEFGWDIDPDTTTAMQEELAELKKGQMSSVLVSDSSVGAYEIIHVLDTYTFTTTDLDVSEVPPSMKKVLSSLTQSRVWTISCNSWLAEQINDNLQENDMPEGLVYDIEPKDSNGDEVSSADTGSEDSAAGTNAETSSEGEN